MNIFRKSSLLLVLLFLTSSCSKVAFQASQDSNSGNGTTNTDPGVTPTGTGSVVCDVYFNTSGTLTASVNSSAQNPTLRADCQPSNATLNWSVKTSAGAVASITGLTGASSVPDFYSAGTGVYNVILNATASGYTDYNSGTLTATVTVPTPVTTPTITCDVKVNNQYAAVTINQGGTNPTFTTNCTPSTGGAYVWTVTSGTSNVTVAGLTGSTSTPDFESLPQGTYNVSVQVSETGYNPYRTTTPLVVIVAPKALTPKTFTSTVTAQNNQLDVLLIVDDSSSMLTNNLKLASKLQGFVTNLTTAGFDWQMCVTVTRALQVTSTDPTLYWGASILWSGYTGSPAYVLKAGATNVNQIFTNTINNIGAGWAGTDDERPIKAAWWHIWNGDPSYSGASGCYRKDAGLAVVMISNEDERSVGGDCSQAYYTGECLALTSDDMPANLVTQVKSVFGNNKRFVFNSVIVRPGDTTCKATQDAQGTISHYGVVDAQAASLTNGYNGSICDADYSTSLNYFKDQIVTQMQSVTLDCAPVGAITVNISPSMSYTYNVNQSSVTFNPAIPAGSTINIQYNCN